MFSPSFPLFQKGHSYAKATLIKAAGAWCEEKLRQPNCFCRRRVLCSIPQVHALSLFILGPRNKVTTVRSQYLYFVSLKSLIPSLTLFLFIQREI